MTYHSELGQDKFLEAKFFRGKRDGVFIELGATDGVHNSNTLYYEKNLGWTGLLIEPIPWYFEEGHLRENRPNSICEQVAIDTKEGEADLFLIKEDFVYYRYNDGYAGGHSGLNKYYEPKQRDRVNNLPCKKTLLKVPCVPLQKLLDKHGITHVDYLSLDVEGGEAAVLDSIDFDNVTIDVMTIEDHWDNETIHKCIEKLTTLGYKQVARLGHDIVLSRIPEVRSE
jgi:FkbM family methyltransferase